MKTIIEKLIAAFSSSSLLHGLAMAIGAALLQVIYPIITAWQNGQPYVLPTWQSIVGVAAGAAFLYLTKNSIFGSSVKVPDVTPSK